MAQTLLVVLAGYVALPPLIGWLVVDAARALGMTGLAINLLVVLPQALKRAIPGIVGTLIRLFKDSSLVTIVGIFDLLGIVQAATADPAWPDVVWEGYLSLRRLRLLGLLLRHGQLQPPSGAPAGGSAPVAA
ncbi:MAG: hypothetical protein IT561_22285 [Alphaproteobacteria bacterium]|nr:hypothetical protein [Alphaproteobacteria bacterium]